MEWQKAFFGNPDDPQTFTAFFPAGPGSELADGITYSVDERDGVWFVVKFWLRDGGSQEVSRHASQEAAYQEAERLLAQGKA